VIAGALPETLANEMTGVVLAGGRGQRMDGADKGLQMLAGRPLVAHVLARLRPQVSEVLISANRHVDAYAAFGHPVLMDEDGEMGARAGPLAGVLAALSACRTPWLVCVPCDAPRLPLDLAQRLRDAAECNGAAGDGATAKGAAGALVCTGVGEGHQQLQPTFMLLDRRLAQPLREALARGERSVRRFAAAQGIVAVHFDDEAAFANLNTLQDLASMEQAWAC